MNDLSSLAKIEHLQSSVDATIEAKLSRMDDEDLRLAVEEFLLNGPTNAVGLLKTYAAVMPLDTAAMLGSVYLRVYLRRKELQSMETETT
jgi:hypothetical protein